MAHYLVTGHTGFKGSWLTMLLAEQGHDVSGIALDPEEESLFNKADVSQYLQSDIRCDIRNRDQLVDTFQKIQPDYVIHLAAQALVLEGYRKPIETYETNVLGTLNVLVATGQTDSVKAQLIVTTDKVYRNDGRKKPYVETDPLGGNDPYSASKAAADILAQERLRRPEAKPGAIARAGNVIGAGDYSKDRLIPDIIRSVAENVPLRIRNPKAVRPWQHVLDCLAGYLSLLHAVPKKIDPIAFNFGPGNGTGETVEEVIEMSQRHLCANIPADYLSDGGGQEEEFLLLDSSLAESQLGWSNQLNFAEAVRWSLASLQNEPAQVTGNLLASQIREFLKISHSKEAKSGKSNHAT